MQPGKVSTWGLMPPGFGGRSAADDAPCLQVAAGFYNALMGYRDSGSASEAADSLRREIAQLEHELRRVRDGLERNPSHALEQRARQLRDNIALCERQLDAELRVRPGGE